MLKPIILACYAKYCVKSYPILTKFSASLLIRYSAHLAKVESREEATSLASRDEALFYVRCPAEFRQEMMNASLEIEPAIESLHRAKIDTRLISIATVWMEYLDSAGKLPHLEEILAAAPEDLQQRYYILERASSCDVGATFRYREVGNNVIKIWGDDFTGKLIDDVLPPERLGMLRGIFEAALSDGFPHFWHANISTIGSMGVGFDRVLLPVVDIDSQEILLGLMYWHDEDANSAEPPVCQVNGLGTGQKGTSTQPDYLQIRLEIEGSPIMVENLMPFHIVADPDAFQDAMAAPLHQIRSALNTSFSGGSGGMLRMAESQFDLHMAISLSHSPREDDNRFLEAVSPALTAFRGSILRMVERGDAHSDEGRRWHVRPRYDSFVSYRLQRAASDLNRYTTKSLKENNGIALPEARIIAVLGQDGMQTVSDTADRTNMDRALVSRTLGKLKSSGLVEKIDCSEDKRIAWLALTETGRDLWDTMFPAMRDRNDALIKNVSADDLRTFYRVLDTIRAVAGPRSQ
jgi:MarR family 2-MHQ and catechol resistance regulon transcriptional repressor